MIIVRLPLRCHLSKAAVLALLIGGPTCAATFTLPKPGNDIVGEMQVIVATHADTLPDLARRFGLGYSEITAANPGVDPWVPGEGTRIVLPTQFVLPPGPRRGLVLNLAQLRLFYFPTPARGQPAQVITHPVGIGTEYASTPLGETRVARKEVNPVWRPSQDVREEHVADGHWLAAQVPPGPENPLGKYALYLALKGSYLIHGTNKPYGVGMRVSHGCIRLYPESIESLYPQVPVGTPVRIIKERVLLGVRGGVVYVQAFRSIDKRGEDQQNLTPHIETVLRQVPRGTTVDWNKVVGLLSTARGFPVPITPGSPDADQIASDAAEVAAETPDARR